MTGRPRVVVLGADGGLAREMLRTFGDAAVGIGRAEADVTDAARIGQTLTTLAPDWVINPCAFHRVDDCESDPALAFAVNALGAGAVASAAAAIGAGVVFISTDYVFDGEEGMRLEPYAETDAPEPLNAYGASKLAGELLVRQRNPRHLVLRTASLYGWSPSRKGESFPELMVRKGRAGERLRVVDDQVMSPTFTLDVARMTERLIGTGATGTFHVANEGECSWYELAREVLSLAGIDAEVEAVASTDVGRPARRPKYSALSSRRAGAVTGAPMRPWREALRAYMGGRAGR